MILPALARKGYAYTTQVVIGNKPNGRKHKVDAVVTAPDGRGILLSMKWQETGGTAEEKIPYELMLLHDAIHKSGGKYDKAYLVLGGDTGWTLKKFYLEGGIKPFFDYSKHVEILTLEGFVTRANQAKL